MSDSYRKILTSMATLAGSRPKTALEYYRELAAEADTSERGTPEDSAAYELEVFEDWRSLREKAAE